MKKQYKRVKQFYNSADLSRPTSGKVRLLKQTEMGVKVSGGVDGE